MAMVKVCDKCGTPILQKGTRVLWKVEGQETLSVDLCEKCSVEFGKVVATLTVATAQAEKVNEPEKETKKNGKKPASE